MRRVIVLWRMMGRDLRMLRTELARADRPTWLLPAAIALGVFALDPLNIALPVFGVVDDLVLLPLLLRGLIWLAHARRAAPLGRRADERVVAVQ